MEVKFKKLKPGAVTPSYARNGDAGLDLTATSMRVVDEKVYRFIEYGTDIAVEIPEGYYGCLTPRSSISKYGLILANSPCTIDSGYRGELLIRFKYIRGTNVYEIGDRIAQLIVLPYPTIELVEVEELAESERGTGAFGHTGT